MILVGEEYSKDQILRLVDESIIYGTTADLYDIMISRSSDDITRERIKIVKYLNTVMYQNNIEPHLGYNKSDITPRKISDIVKEHRSKKINEIVK